MPHQTDPRPPLAPSPEDRPLWPAMLRGWRCKCPSCGSGPLLTGYLSVTPTCKVCREELHHQRADDGPAYLTILIVGHIIVPIMVTVFLLTDLSNATHIAIWVPLTLVMTLLLLRPIKGVIIGLQWALYMHGFDTRSDPDAMPEGYLRIDPA